MTRNSVDATELSDVAAAAGTSLSMVRSLFYSKAELLEALAEDFVRANGIALQQVAGWTDDAADVVASSIRHTVRFADAGPVRTWLLRNDDDYARALTEDLGRRLLRDLSNGVWLGRFSTSSVLLQHRMIQGAVLGVLRAKPHGQFSPDAAEELAVSILQMLGVPPEEAATIATRPLAGQATAGQAATSATSAGCQSGTLVPVSWRSSSAPRVCRGRRRR
jgi:AcrR family transcriptional regulator